MHEIPNGSNFFSCLYTSMTRREVAEIYASKGFEVRSHQNGDFEISLACAELTIEADSPILVHGPVADVATNADRLLAPLREAGVAYFADWYDDDGKLIEEATWKPSENPL